MDSFKRFVTARATANSDKRSEISDSSSSRKQKLSRFKLRMRLMSHLGMAAALNSGSKSVVTYENTYKTEPDDHRKFSRLKAEQVIFSVLEGYLSGRDYDPKRFLLLSKTLSELIKDRVKSTGLERYKIVAIVTMCENKDQGARVASRCLWDQKYDNHASVVYEGRNFFAVGSVYAVYFD